MEDNKNEKGMPYSAQGLASVKRARRQAYLWVGVPLIVLALAGIGWLWYYYSQP